MFFVLMLATGLSLADPPEPTVDTSACAQTGKLQKKAMLGKLEDEIGACLEARVASGEPMHVLDASLLLIADAHGKGDKALWAARVQRHLQYIDETDADLAVEYGNWLLTQPGNAQTALDWAEVALAHAYRFSETERDDRLYSAYALRARAMEQLWKGAEKSFGEDPSAGDKRMAAFAAQGRARLYAVEWMKHARSVGRSTADGFALCVETGWTEQRCAEALEEGSE